MFYKGFCVALRATQKYLFYKGFRKIPRFLPFFGRRHRIANDMYYFILLVFRTGSHALCLRIRWGDCQKQKLVGGIQKGGAYFLIFQAAGGTNLQKLRLGRPTTSKKVIQYAPPTGERTPRRTRRAPPKHLRKRRLNGTFADLGGKVRISVDTSS